MGRFFLNYLDTKTPKLKEIGTKINSEFLYGFSLTIHKQNTDQYRHLYIKKILRKLNNGN